MPEARPPAPHADALAALRERGIDRREPVRFRLAEALARRAGTHSGAARAVLDAKLAALLGRLSTAGEHAAPGVAASAARGPLGELVDGLAQRQAQPPASGLGDASRQAAADPATLQFFKRTWSRLSADQRLAQSQAALPGNAGPLNSQHLVHRSLTLMHDLSPGYLAHFVGHVDALLWLERANEAAVRPVNGRKSMPARR